jgi:DegV family protein with EDD domain
VTPHDAQAGALVVITDSAASLPGELRQRYQIQVVPLRLLAGGVTVDDGAGVGGSDAISSQLVAVGRVSTSGPPPDRFTAEYQRASAGGAGAAVCVLMAREFSGTVSSAELAGVQAPIPVHVVDSRSIGMGTGLVALAAAEGALAGAGVAEVAALAERRAELASTFVSLASAGASLGGRLPAPGLAQAALRSRPLLEVRDGRVEVIERVRTAGAALARLAELAATFCEHRAADVGVLHTADPERATALAGLIREALPGAVVHVAEASAAIAVHAGPGMLAVSVAPRAAPDARP